MLLEATLQRVCAVSGEVNACARDPACLLTEEHRQCPFCPDRHRLRLHGFYERQAIVPGHRDTVTVKVLRLYCARQRRTVSLLPDFCLPRRQHGPGILGVFLKALVFEGRSLLDALRQARPDAPTHSVGQGLLEGFTRRLPQLCTYLASLRHRVVESAALVPAALRALATVIAGLLHGHTDTGAAFVAHGRSFHRRFCLGLA